MSSALAIRPITRPTLGMTMVLCAGSLFALNGTVSKLLIQGGFDAPQLTTFRAAGAFLGLLALAAVVKPGPRRLLLRRAELPLLIGFGLTGFFLVPMLYFVAISRLPVGIGLLLEFMAPLFVALWARFGRRQQVRPQLWVGLTVCLTGLTLVAALWSGRLDLDPLGTAAGLAAAILLAVYYLLGTRSAADRDPISMTCWAFGVSAVAGAIVRPWWHFPFGVLGQRSDGVPMWLLACYLITLGTIGPYLLVSAAMAHLPPTSVGIVGMIEPVLAGGFAWVLLDEVLSGTQLLGGFFVLVGVLLAETARVGGPGQPPELALT